MGTHDTSDSKLDSESPQVNVMSPSSTKTIMSGYDYALFVMWCVYLFKFVFQLIIRFKQDIYSKMMAYIRYTSMYNILKK